MTTPERFRTRQRLEAAAVALLAFALAGAWLYFRERTDVVVECVVDYAENQSTTTQNRAAINEAERNTTRQIIRRAFEAETSAQAQEAFRDWRRRTERIDRRTARNPVVVFDVEDCTG